jgi:hypothetical protein
MMRTITVLWAVTFLMALSAAAQTTAKSDPLAEVDGVVKRLGPV